MPLSRSVWRVVSSCFAVVALGALAACEFDERTIAPGRPRIVVHAVLNPFGGREYVVLLERTLTGRVATADSAFDSDDPIVTGGGEPITGAYVEISGAVGIEDVTVRSDGKGRGVYRFLNVGCGLFGCEPNAKLVFRARTYELTVRAPGGGTVRGTTTVPSPRFNPDTVAARVFDRERETYTFTWNAELAEQTKRFAVQIQTPYGPFELFTSEPSVALTGELRSPFVERIPYVFIPGFRQALNVLAVDSNYFDYYRSVNDPFTGSGLLTHLEGGTGVFGSVVPVRGTLIEVVAPIDEPGEGTWKLEGDTARYPTFVTIFYTGDIATGRVDDIDQAPVRRQFLGTRTGPRDAPVLSLRVLDAVSFLEADADSPTAYLMTGEARADTLFLSVDGGPTQRWLRVAGPP